MKDIKPAKADDFFASIAQIIEQARNTVVKSVDTVMCITYFNIGKGIVEEEQGGAARAKYGSRLLAELSNYLISRYGRGYSETNLRSFRKFYKVYKDSIQQMPSAKFNTTPQIRQMPSAEFTLGWSQYQILMRIDDPAERHFYELEAAEQQWSVEQLKRQYHSSLYERLALSKDKNGVLELSKKGHVLAKPKDILKTPMVLEFLGLEEKAGYSETDLEGAIIDKLQKFLLELGKGFLFEARQKRFSYDEQNFFVDLVFYNRLLQCYVLIDLKTDELKHQDIGQMQMYVNYYDRKVKQDFEKPTIGILLCKEKNDSIVEMTLPDNSNIYASEYKLYLPDKKLLQKKLSEWVAEYEAENE
ncbi:MAG: PDDEXK nuclease domain-containing protein [Spirochaetaceae bacterium]|jgi:predicted nuclease of restriction endonuclease-like (RecB) superfamily|nr:PDDEXK nuclease domain-containing protein [Spirochaetaceae bacterium]